MFVKSDDGLECLDVDECAEERERCPGENEKCVNYPGGFDCVEVTTTTPPVTTTVQVTTAVPTTTLGQVTTTVPATKTDLATDCVTIFITPDLAESGSNSGLSVTISTGFDLNEVTFPPPLTQGSRETACFDSTIPVVLKSSLNATEKPCVKYDDVNVTVELLGTVSRNSTADIDPVNIKLWLKLDCEEFEKEFSFGETETFWVGKCEDFDSGKGRLQKSGETCCLENCLLNTLPKPMPSAASTTSKAAATPTNASSTKKLTTTAQTTTTTQTAITRELDCPAGFNPSNDSTHCLDIDECASNPQICSGTNQICENLPGNYQCTCENGFRFYKSECLDVDECTENLHPCTNEQNCVNYSGGFKCIQKYQPVYKPTVGPRHSTFKKVCLAPKFGNFWIISE